MQRDERRASIYTDFRDSESKQQNDHPQVNETRIRQTHRKSGCQEWNVSLISLAIAPGTIVAIVQSGPPPAVGDTGQPDLQRYGPLGHESHHESPNGTRYS